MRNFIIFFLFTILSVNIFSQFDCAGVPVQSINLCGPETEITLEDREGDCCEGTNCIILQINTCQDQCFDIQIIGAPANGALDIYEGDCSNEIEIGDVISINGSTTILFCKPGNNTYTIVKTPIPCDPVVPCTPTSQPSIFCYQTATFNNTTCQWDVTGTQPAQPSLACYQTATFNNTTCQWDVTGTQPAQPSLACYQTATFNNTTCQWDVTGTQPAQPSLACYQTATFNNMTCQWDVTGTQPAQPSLACYQTATFNNTTCQWDVTGTQPAQPSLACYQTATFNNTTCQWDVTGTQPAQPSLACYQTATFNNTTCQWDVTGTQPAQPSLACYQTATFNNMTCQWDVTGTQPAQPSLACYQTATFNNTTCQWDVTGTQPAQPSLACYQTATFNNTTCQWDVTGTQPAQPSLACYQTATFNNTTCQWDVTGTQPAQPSLACYQTATFNNTTCQWDVTGTQPAQPSLACYQTATFNNTTCQWDVTGTQPAQPSLACYQTATFNNTTCQWDVTGTQPAQPSSINCWDNYQFNSSTCIWENQGTQDPQPDLSCYQTGTWNDESCSWEITNTEPPVFPNLSDIIINCSSVIPGINLVELLNFFGTPATSVELVSENSNGASCPEIITRTFKITHPCGFEIRTQQIIHYPLVNFTMPAHVSHIVNCINQAILENVEYPEVLDGCGNPILPSTPTISDEPSPLSCNGQRTFTFNYVNCEGRTYIWKYTFVIQDNIQPTANALPRINVSCRSEIPLPDISVVTNVQDNCGTTIVNWVSDVSDGATCPEKITRTYTVTDNCGNVLVLTQQIVVSDNIPPTASNLPTINVSSLSNVPTPNPSEVIDESDNCGVESVVWTNDTEEMAGCKIITRTYTITDFCGNSTNVQQLINICSTDQIFHVPNTFTPDGNQHNNTFYPVFSTGFVPKEYELLIFDRWGELIFQSNNLQVGWDGTYGTEGKKCQDGTYTWKIQFNFKEGAGKTQETGHVNLLR